MNATKCNTLLSNVVIANQFFSRLKGLLGTKELHEDFGMIIIPCRSVHTFFMNFTIDVAFVNKKGRVCYIITSMKKNRVSPIVKDSYYVLEAPEGTFMKVNLEIGDEISLLSKE